MILLFSMADLELLSRSRRAPLRSFQKLLGSGDDNHFAHVVQATPPRPYLYILLDLKMASSAEVGGFVDSNIARAVSQLVNYVRGWPLQSTSVRVGDPSAER